MIPKVGRRWSDKSEITEILHPCLNVCSQNCNKTPSNDKPLSFTIWLDVGGNDKPLSFTIWLNVGSNDKPLSFTIWLDVGIHHHSPSTCCWTWPHLVFFGSH